MQKARFLIQNKKSRLDGMGAFAGEAIIARKKIGELSGEIISQQEGRKRAAATLWVAIVEFGNGKALDASGTPDVLRYINHSCVLNAYMRIRYPRVEFYALQQIEKGEEITCNYSLTHHDGKLRCRCGNPLCKQYL